MVEVIHVVRADVRVFDCHMTYLISAHGRHNDALEKSKHLQQDEEERKKHIARAIDAAGYPTLTNIDQMTDYTVYVDSVGIDTKQWEPFVTWNKKDQ